MKIPPYWSRHDFTATVDGWNVTRSALGWSFTSQSEADELAASRARRAVAAAQGGSCIDEYYSVIPIREPLLKTLDVGGDVVGLVTRNRYGCRVLNTDRVLFADVDLPPTFARVERQVDGFFDRIRSLFGRRVARQVPSRETESSALEHIERWHVKTGIAARVYRTFAGLRLIVVDRQCSPLDANAMEILKTLNSDPLYVSLTRRQECFRARLTPKPWRIGISTPWFPSPFSHPDYAAKLEDWAIAYEQRATAFGVCRLVKIYGGNASDPVIRAIVELHDSMCLREGMTLA